MTFTFWWLVWIAAFAVIEGLALFNSRPGDTLSEHVRVWFRTRKEDRAGADWTYKVPRIILASFLLWLPLHFFFPGVF